MRSPIQASLVTALVLFGFGFQAYACPTGPGTCSVETPQNPPSNVVVSPPSMPPPTPPRPRPNILKPDYTILPSEAGRALAEETRTLKGFYVSNTNQFSAFAWPDMGTAVAGRAIALAAHKASGILLYKYGGMQTKDIGKNLERKTRRQKIVEDTYLTSGALLRGYDLADAGLSKDPNAPGLAIRLRQLNNDFMVVFMNDLTERERQVIDQPNPPGKLWYMGLLARFVNVTKKGLPEGDEVPLTPELVVSYLMPR